MNRVTFFTYNLRSLLFLAGFFLVFFSIFAYTQNVNAVFELGPEDENSQSDDDDDDDKDDDSVNLSKSKYTPTGLGTVAHGEHQINLTWTDNAKKEDGYDVQRRSSGSWNTIARIGRNTETYSDNTVLSGTSYVYRVAAFDHDKQTAWSNESTAKTTGLTPAQKAQTAQTQALAEQEAELKEEFETILRVETEKVREEYLHAADCSLTEVPVQEVEAAFIERCENLTGQDLSTEDSSSGSFWHGIINNTRARLFLVIGIFILVINNVIWHIRHKTVKNRLKGEF